MIASSITTPTISVKPSIVNWLSVPIAAISAKVETIDVGMAMAAISVGRRRRRRCSPGCCRPRGAPRARDRRADEDRLALLTDAEHRRQRGGQLASLAFTCSATVTLFCPDCFCTMSVTALLPFRNDALRSSWPSTTSAMSFRRTT